MGLIRVSKVGGRDDILSPDIQRAAITSYAESRQMVMVRWVEALDESGSQARSPWWQRLDQAVQWIEDGEADAILVWKYSRAARHRRHWAVAVDRVETAGGVLESATEATDTTTSTGRLARGMLAELAAWDAETKGEVWREVAASRLSRGLPASGRDRYGYTYTRAGGYEPDPGEAVVVRAMYEQFIGGDTFSAIAKRLGHDGGRTRSGAWWQPTMLGRFLDSGFAAGVILHNGVEHPGAHEPLITPEVWAAYRRVRETTRRQAPRTRAAGHPLAGLIRCGSCGGPCCRSTQPGKDGQPRRLFVCCRVKQIPGSCDGPRVMEWRAHEAVKAWLAQVAEEVTAKANAISQSRAQAARARVDIKRIDRDMARLDEAIARLAVQAAQGLLPASAHALAVESLLRDREALETRQNDAERVMAASTVPPPVIARGLLDSWDELVEHDPKGLRDVLASLISFVEVTRGEGRLSEVRVVPRWEA